MRVVFSIEKEDIVPAHKASPLQLSPEHERELKNLVRARSTPQKLAERVRIILLAATGLGVAEPAQATGHLRKTAGQRRWQDAAASATFTPGDDLALACEDPEALDVPISHWSQSELARQAVARGIAKSISHGSVGRLLKKRPISSRTVIVIG
jgi:putative transposase